MHSSLQQLSIGWNTGRDSGLVWVPTLHLYPARSICCRFAESGGKKCDRPKRFLRIMQQLSYDCADNNWLAHQSCNVAVPVALHYWCASYSARQSIWDLRFEIKELKKATPLINPGAGDRPRGAFFSIHESIRGPRIKLLDCQLRTFGSGAAVKVIHPCASACGKTF